MRSRLRHAALAAALATALAVPARAAEPRLGDLSRVGTVSLPTSCDPALQAEFDRGLALLHSFFYAEARRIFEAVAAKDPDCAMAHWGVAMTWYHPIWTPPDSAELAVGRAAAARAAAAKKQSPREREWVNAIRAYYEATGADPAAAAAAEKSPASCHGAGGAVGADAPARARAYSAAMEAIHRAHPEDTEAAAFFALSLLGTAKPGDLTNPRRSAAILEPFYAKHGNHPGLAHYLIHSYDYPPLARQGLAAANAYARMQPWVPHALHMPSHIYTRLGMWQENIESNAASAAASRAYAAKYHPGAASFEELHALDYQIYGHLQKAEDGKARAALERLAAIEKTHPETDLVVGYAFGAMPARFALERRQWKEAAALELRPMPFWSRLPFSEGHIVYARAVGAARSGDLAAAERWAGRLDELAAQSVDPRFKYFSEQMSLQVEAARGLIALARGAKEDAVRRLRAAAAREDSLGKHPVSPGAILPIRELLAETLLETGRAAEALAEFEAALAIYPRRFNGVAGAALAAEKAGRNDAARRYYGELIELAKEGDGQRPELRHAADFLKRS